MTCSILGRAASIAAGLSLACSLPGCTGSGPEGPKTQRVNASGNVTLDGQPVPAGTVTFLHTETGNMAVCPISDGTYESESEQGPNPGTNTVQIVGMESAEGNPLWGGAWTKQVQVGDSDFTEDYSIAKNELQPYDPKSRPVDD